MNKLQSTEEELDLLNKPQEVREQFYDFMNTVPMLRWLVSDARPRACDLPRDDKGRIIVDVTKPHILEDMDYFRPTALNFQKYGKLYPYPVNTELEKRKYKEWYKEEIRRCWYGYVRESDGEWITGDCYFFWNYCPIMLSRMIEGTKMAERIIDFPEVWEGHYLKFHYIYQARLKGKHGAELASRGKGKSFTMASMLAKRFLIGESKKASRKLASFASAYQKEYLTKDGLLSKFQTYIDFCTESAPHFPIRRLRNNLQEMQWQAGYEDVKTGVKKGTLNEVIGVTSKDNISKLRGKRGALIILEEFGSFPNLLQLYGNLRPSVEDGDSVFGQIFCMGTAGDKDSDFQGACELMYNPTGYNMNPLPNVFDKEGQGRPTFVFFFGGYMNRKGCYDKNGNSDVTKALLQILEERYNVKYNTSDVNAITKAISEVPITPAEAILRSNRNIFPVIELTERLNQLDINLHSYDDVHVGDLVFRNGKVEFSLGSNMPIRDFPLQNNKAEGALEIFSMPKTDAEGKVFPDRYIIGHDPVDDDVSSSLSLTSTFVLDLWTDEIVAEWTGRLMFAEENFEVVRKLCMFYNCKVLYECNKKGLYAYFAKMNCTHLMADCPEYLKDKDLVKVQLSGNKLKGVNATAPINNYANTLIRDWLRKPITIVEKDENDKDIEVTVSNLYRLKNRALIKELINFNPQGNFDRIRALGMVMLYREEKMIMYGGDVRKAVRVEDKFFEDDFFKKYDRVLEVKVRFGF